jgi:hypothetical protein
MPRSKPDSVRLDLPTARWTALRAAHTDHSPDDEEEEDNNEESYWKDSVNSYTT